MASYAQPLIYSQRTTPFASGCLEQEIQKFLASGKLPDSISALPLEQLIQITARAVEVQAEIQWKLPLKQMQRELATERHNASLCRKQLADLLQKESSREHPALRRCWRQVVLLAMQLFDRRKTATSASRQ